MTGTLVIVRPLEDLSPNNSLIHNELNTRDHSMAAIKPGFGDRGWYCLS